MRFSDITAFILIVAASTVSPAFAEETRDFVIVTRTPNGPIVNPSDNPHLNLRLSVDQQKKIIELLSRYKKFGFGVEDLVEIAAENDAVNELNIAIKSELSDAILAWTKPLQASNIESNLNGYQALANLDPKNVEYIKKRDSYAEKVKQQSLEILERFKTKKDDFNGITWYTHKNEPRYSDTRSYVSLYLGKKEGEKPTLRFVVNYTSDSWLFVKNAQANIDGTIVDIPNAEWHRDNDSEIWEWIDVIASESIIDLSQQISESKKTIIRFNGQQYFDDYTVTASDKQVLHDGLIAFEAMSR